MKNQFRNPRDHRRDFFKSYHKSFHEFKLTSSSIAPKYGEVVGWHVLSSGRRSTLFKFLFLKWLWDELTFQEFKFITNLPEFFSSEEFVACTRVLASGLPKKEIRTRLNNFRKLRGLKPLSHERYRAMKRGFVFSLVEYTFSPLPTKKYSGWTRHHKDHGTLGRVLLEPMPSVFTETFEIDLFKVLSVGNVKILNTVFSLSPDDDSKESKQSKKKPMKFTENES